MNFTLNQLRIFSKIVENKSITKAAEELHLTQPAVSIQLKKFQEQFEIPLTEIIGRKVYITEFGEEIAVVVNKLLSDIKEVDYISNLYKGELSGKLRVSIVSTGKYIMPFFLSDFLTENKGVDLNMDVTNKNSVIQSLEQNKVDFSLVSIIPENIETEQMSLIENKLYLIANKNINASKYKSISQFLEDIPLIYREKGSGTRQAMEKFLMENNLSGRKKIELTSNEAIKQAVLAGMGCSIMPYIGIKTELLSGDLQIIPFEGLPIVTNWSLIWSKGKGHSPVAKSALEYIQEHKEEIIKRHFSSYDDV